MAKIKINMNNALLEHMETLSYQNYTSLSGMISMACANYVQQQRITEGIVTAAKAMQRISETGVMSDADKAELEAFSTASTLYSHTL